MTLLGEKSFNQGLASVAHRANLSGIENCASRYEAALVELSPLTHVESESIAH